jgi:hypothetical protein
MDKGSSLTYRAFVRELVLASSKRQRELVCVVDAMMQQRASVAKARLAEVQAKLKDEELRGERLVNAMVIFLVLCVWPFAAAFCTAIWRLYFSVITKNADIALEHRYVYCPGPWPDNFLLQYMWLTLSMLPTNATYCRLAR